MALSESVDGIESVYRVKGLECTGGTILAQPDKMAPNCRKKSAPISESELSANNPVDDTYFNWTDIEAHLN